MFPYKITGDDTYTLLLPQWPFFFIFAVVALFIIGISLSLSIANDSKNPFLWLVGSLVTLWAIFIVALIVPPIAQKFDIQQQDIHTYIDTWKLEGKNLDTAIWDACHPNTSKNYPTPPNETTLSVTKDGKPTSLHVTANRDLADLRCKLRLETKENKGK